MQFPTGGIVRDPLSIRYRLIWCDSKTDSIVWMREENMAAQADGICADFTYVFKPRDVLSRGFLSYIGQGLFFLQQRTRAFAINSGKEEKD